MEWFLTVKAWFAIWLMGVLRMDNEELKLKLQAFLDADKDYDYAKDSADFAAEARRKAESDEATAAADAAKALEAKQAARAALEAVLDAI